jgi:sugar O-acyltransferase (sialic acid O-acetyltransferase NeuD family)
VAAPVVVIGAGGFGRETLDVIEAINGRDDTFRVLGVVDSAPSSLNLRRLSERNVNYLGSEDEWLAEDVAASYVLAVGNPVVRATIAERWNRAGRSTVTLVHPSAVVGSRSSVGPGSVICAGAQISTNVVLGESVHVNPNATVGHDSVLNDFVSVNPGAVVSGDVTVGARSLIGAGAVILQGLRVGGKSIIGAAACVIRDVPSDSTFVGVPARQLRSST